MRKRSSRFLLHLSLQVRKEKASDWFKLRVHQSCLVIGCSTDVSWRLWMHHILSTWTFLFLCLQNMQITVFILPSLNYSVVLALNLCVNLLFSFAFSCFSVFPAGFVVLHFLPFFVPSLLFAPVMLFSSSCILADTFFAQGFVFNCIFPSLFFCHLPETLETRASAALSGWSRYCHCRAVMRKMNDDKDHSTASVMALEDLSTAFFGWITKCCRKTNMLTNFYAIKRWNKSKNWSVAAAFWAASELRFRRFLSNPVCSG